MAREDRFRSWLEEQDPSGALTVFVGSSSREKAVLASLARAYELRDEVQPELPLGGVAIAERHARRGDEHLRLIAKQTRGCCFFITQIVYDVNAAKNLISDYHHECAAQSLKPVPIVFSFSVCGSLKTLEFPACAASSTEHGRFVINSGGVGINIDRRVRCANALIRSIKQVALRRALTAGERRADASMRSSLRPPARRRRWALTCGEIRLAALMEAGPRNRAD
jgi:hypothetical protein